MKNIDKALFIVYWMDHVSVICEAVGSNHVRINFLVSLLFWIWLQIICTHLFVHDLFDISMLNVHIHTKSAIQMVQPQLSSGSTQEDPSWHDWKIVDWDVKNQIKQTKINKFPQSQNMDRPVHFSEERKQMKQNIYDSEKITDKERKKQPKTHLFCVHIRKMYLKKVHFEKKILRQKSMQTFPELKCILQNKKTEMSRDTRFPAMWYVWPAKAQISVRIGAVWSEHWLAA